MMIHLKDGLSLKSQLSDFSSLIVHCAVVLLLLTHSCGGQPQMIGPSQPIVAMVGDDITLPCHLKPAKDVVFTAVEWARADLHPRFVHVRRDGVELLIDQNPSYIGRTSVSINKLKLGDVSLKLSKVKLSDNGVYKCYIPELDSGSTVHLVVGAVSSPGISITKDLSGEAVMLQCESKGSYPEPEVSWLDSEGNLLPAGSTATVRGPDDLYTVSSRVTVEKRHSNSFTCRVQQNNISLTRHTHIHVADNVFMVPSCFTVRIGISLAACFMSILTVICIVWKCRQLGTRNKITRCSNSMECQPINEGANREKLIGERNESVDGLDNKNPNPDGELLEENLEQVKEMVEKLKDQKSDLHNQKKTVNSLLEKVEKQIEESEKKIENSGKFDKKKQKKCEAAKKDLESRKDEHEEMLQFIEKLLETTEEMIMKMKQIKKRLRKDK